MIENVELNVDDLITELVSAKNLRPGSKLNLDEKKIITLLVATRQVLLTQPMLLELTPPLNVCGDLHGQFFDLLRLFEIGNYPPDSNYLFLGDYVDRAQNSIETVCLLFCYKVKYPENFFLLRGNHESASINRIYGFFDECKRRYNVKLWKLFGDVFNCLPVAALISNKIFCMHGGLSQHLASFFDINRIRRPCEVPDDGILCDLLWADPDLESRGFRESERGVSYSFGLDVLQQFLREKEVELICRAHQVVEDGYEFISDRSLVTIFSAPNYCGEFNNAAGMMSIDKDLMCNFHILKARNRRRTSLFAQT